MRGPMRRSGRAVATAVGLLVLLSAPVVLAADTTIQVADFSFPATTTIEAGDTAPPPDPGRGDPTALLLAILGVAMVIGTFLADRRFAAAPSRKDHD